MNAPEELHAPAFRASLYVSGATERGVVLDPTEAKALGIALVRASVEGQAVRIVLPPRVTPRADRGSPRLRPRPQRYLP